MKKVFFIVLLGIVMILAIPRFAFAWCDSCGSGGCCRCPGQAQCLGSHASCEEACGLTNSTSGGGAAMPPATDVQGAFMQGMMNGILQNINTPPRPKTPEEIESERQVEIARQQAEQERQRKIQEYLKEEARKKKEKEDALDLEAESALSLVHHPPSKVGPGLSDEDLIGSKNNTKYGNNSKFVKNAFYDKGFKASSQCFSASAGVACSGATAGQMEDCVRDYNNGFDVGQKQNKEVMKEAFEAGKNAGIGGGLANGASDPRADGDCRTQWIENYNQGYFQGKHAKK